jgi:hypothetical protein
LISLDGEVAAMHILFIGTSLRRKLGSFRKNGFFAQESFSHSVTGHAWRGTEKDFRFEIGDLKLRRIRRMGPMADWHAPTAFVVWPNMREV